MGSRHGLRLARWVHESEGPSGGTPGATNLWFLVLAVLTLLGPAACVGADAGSVLNPYGNTEATLKALDAKRRDQLEGAARWEVFHGFRFTDQREASGIRFRQTPVEDGAKHYKAVHYDHGTGVATADVDGDGRLDLYFVNQVGGNQLWRNLGGGRFEDMTAAAGVGLPDKVCVGASFADLDNDGLPDLFVTTVRMGHVLFRNLGGGRFRDITEEAGLKEPRAGHGSGAVFFDFNRDGLLDLFVTRVGVYTRNERGKGGFYLGRSDAFQGWRFPARTEASVLYQNLGGGRFRDVSKEVGLEHRGWSGDATFCDLNRDGYPDLYVLSMSGEDRFYQNEGGGRFVERTAATFPRTPWGAMGVKFLDFNLDGRMDLFVTDMHSDMTGAQIREGDRDFSPEFEQRKSDPWCASEWSPQQQLQATNCIKGNAFYRSEGSGGMAEISGVVGLETYWPWGVTAGDFNADGYEDLFVTAGMGYPLRYAGNNLFLNEGGRRFRASEYVVGIEPRAGNRIETEFFTLDCSGEDARHPLCRGRTGVWSVIGTTSSRSSVAFDVEDDGDLDLISNEWNGMPQVWISDLTERTRVAFLKVRLVGTTSNRDGMGAWVTVRCGDRRFTRYQDGKSGYLSQSLAPLYFGLGQAGPITSIEVEWPSGTKQTLTEGWPSNGLMEIREPR